MSLRSHHRPVVAGAGLLLFGGAAVLLAPAASAGPSSTPAPAAPSSSLPAVPTSSPVLSRAAAPQPSLSAGPTRVAVPAGGAPTRTDGGGWGPAEIALAASGVLLVAGGAAALRRAHR